MFVADVISTQCYWNNLTIRSMVPMYVKTH